MKSVPKALHYELSYFPVSSVGGPVEPTTVIVTSTKQAAIVKNLTPGTIYKLQVRAFGKLGFRAAGLGSCRRGLGLT